jgi:AcrR family transcriptional regulator
MAGSRWRSIYKEGVGVGVEALCRNAGVSKRSMYQLFASKDDGVAASLDRVAPSYVAALIPSDEDGRLPRARILTRLRASGGPGGISGLPRLPIRRAIRERDGNSDPAGAVSIVTGRRSGRSATARGRDEPATAGRPAGLAGCQAARHRQPCSAVRSAATAAGGRGQPRAVPRSRPAREPPGPLQPPGARPARQAPHVRLPPIGARTSVAPSKYCSMTSSGC